MTGPGRVRRWLGAGLVTLAMSLVVVPTLPAPRAMAAADAYSLTEQFVPSFDATTLHVYVFRPSAAGSLTAPTARTPVIMQFTPYDNSGGAIGGVGLGVVPQPTNSSPPDAPSGLVAAGMFSRGYSYVQVADRGTGGSGGCFDLWGTASQQDTKAMIEWAGAQPWSDGKVATYGESAGSFSQITALAMHPPHLVASALEIGSVGSSETWTNGVQNTVGAAWGPAWEANRAYPPSVFSPEPYVFNSVSRNAEDPSCGAVQTVGAQSEPTSDYWRERDAVVAPALAARTPVLWMGGFNDFNAREATYQEMFTSLSGPHWGFFGPYVHGAGTGPQGTSFDRITLDFFDHWTRGTPLSSAPRTLVQDVDGSWRSESDWPPRDAVDRILPLVAGSYTDSPDNTEETRPPSALDVAPAAAPVSTGRGLWTVTTPLTSGTRIAGEIRVRATVSVAAPVSLVALVYDIDRDGNAVFVAHGADRITATGPVSFSLYPQDWSFTPGHRIGMLLSGADAYWFVPSSTLQPVTVSGGSFSLPLLSCRRDSAATGVVPNFVPRSTPAPFTVPAATLVAATVRTDLPAAHACAGATGAAATVRPGRVAALRPALPVITAPSGLAATGGSSAVPLLGVVLLVVAGTAGRRVRVSGLRPARSPARRGSDGPAPPRRAPEPRRRR